MWTSLTDGQGRSSQCGSKSCAMAPYYPRSVATYKAKTHRQRPGTGFKAKCLLYSALLIWHPAFSGRKVVCLYTSSSTYCGVNGRSQILRQSAARSDVLGDLRVIGVPAGTYGLYEPATMVKGIELLSSGSWPWLIPDPEAWISASTPCSAAPTLFPFKVVTSGTLPKAKPLGTLGDRLTEPKYMINVEQSRNDSGVTLLEILVVLAVVLILAALSLPAAKNYRISWQELSGAKSIVSQLALAKMRAASNFSWSEVYCGTTSYSDGSSNSTCQVKLNSAATGNTTFSATNSGDTNGQEPLPPALHFGFGNITVGAGHQSTPAQPNAATPPFQILFNSRGVAIDTSGNPTSNYTLYLYSDMGRYYAISVELTGKPRLWKWGGSQWTEID